MEVERAEKSCELACESLKRQGFLSEDHLNGPQALHRGPPFSWTVLYGGLHRATSTGDRKHQFESLYRIASFLQVKNYGQAAS